MDMKHNKSPGLDGLPADFNQCFWDQLSEIFFEMLDARNKQHILKVNISEQMLD